MADQVWAEVVTIGSELVLGQLLDTNAAFIAAALAEIGVGVAYHTTVGDDRERMREALTLAMDRCQVVITTGGIGPTEDDLTRELAAEVLGVELDFHQDLMDLIEAMFKRAGYKMSSNNRRQAYIPRGAEVIHNPRGTAPCFRGEKNGHVLICLPGVPFETEPLMREVILPFVREKFSPGGRVWINRVLKVCGVGESNVDAQIKDIMRNATNPTIGILSSPADIKLRLTARADDPDEARELLDKCEDEIQSRIGDLIFGYDEDTLPGVAARLLMEKGLTLGVAEALTGGQVMAELSRLLETDLIKGGIVLQQAEDTVGLCHTLLDEYGVDLALAVAGYPGPDGRLKVEIMIMEPDGKTTERTLDIGGPKRILQGRSTTMAFLTLWNMLKGKTW